MHVKRLPLAQKTCDLCPTLSPSVIPNITFPLDDQVYTVNKTDPVTFTCSATGIPPPEITWMRNGLVVDESTEPHISLNFSNPETISTADGDIYLVTHTLTISSTRNGDSDNYTCVASNENTVTPNVTQDFELVVQGRLPFYFYTCTCI